MITKILLSGDGGQGIQLISDMLAQAAFANDFFVSQIPNYGLEQRGGVSLSFLIISDEDVTYPKFTKPDILLIMSEQARERTKPFQQANLILKFDDYLDFLGEKQILVKSYNIFFLGILVKKLEEKKVLTKEAVFKLLEKKLQTKPNWEANQTAFVLGYNN